MYVTRTQVALHANESRTSVQWVSELEVLVPSIGFAVRQMLLYSEPNFTAFWRNAAEQQADFLDDVLNAVAFGDPARQLSSQLAVSPAAYRLLLINGCVPNVLTDAECANYNKSSGCTEFYSMSLCHKDPASVDVAQPIFDSGLVGTGLLPATQQFVLRVKELCRERLVDINAAAQAGGTEPGALDSTPLPRRVLRHDGSSFDIVSQLAKAYLVSRESRRGEDRSWARLRALTRTLRTPAARGPPGSERRDADAGHGAHRGQHERRRAGRRDQLRRARRLLRPALRAARGAARQRDQAHALPAAAVPGGGRQG
jgi:hypothetical protein